MDSLTGAYPLGELKMIYRLLLTELPESEFLTELRTQLQFEAIRQGVDPAKSTDWIRWLAEPAGHTAPTRR